MPADETKNMKDAIDDAGYSSSLDAPPKRTKSRSKLKLLIFLILLAAGAVTGLHHSGIMDVRPFMWNIIPRIPFIGDYLKDNLDIPEVYTLTVEERRKLELEQWQERLDLKEKEILAQITQSETLSNDIAARQQRIDRQESDLLAKENSVRTRSEEATPEQAALINELTDTYQEISPRRSAQIMAQLPDHLAVELMKKLPQDTRASILSRMDPRRAAQLTESLATPQ